MLCYWIEAWHAALMKNALQLSLPFPSLPFPSLAKCPTKVSFTSSPALTALEKVRGMQALTFANAAKMFSTFY